MDSARRFSLLIGSVAFASAVGLALSAPATAAPGEDPCAGPTTLICQLLPVAPELTDDVDLSGRHSGLLLDENQMPIDPCEARGCS